MNPGGEMEEMGHVPEISPRLLTFVVTLRHLKGENILGRPTNLVRLREVIKLVKEIAESPRYTLGCPEHGIFVTEYEEGGASEGRLALVIRWNEECLNNHWFQEQWLA